MRSDGVVVASGSRILDGEEGTDIEKASALFCARLSGEAEFVERWNRGEDSLEFLEGGGDVDGGGFGEWCAVERETRERVGGLAGDGRHGTLYKSVKWRTPDRHNHTCLPGRRSYPLETYQIVHC